MRDSLLSDKSILFAQKVVRLYRFLVESKNETIISKQLLRSGTSIGANISEADYAQSRIDFISKLHIALKETAETEYWFKLLNSSGYISKRDYEDMLNSCIEIKKILISSINTAKSKLNNY